MDGMLKKMYRQVQSGFRPHIPRGLGVVRGSHKVWGEITTREDLIAIITPMVIVTVPVMVNINPQVPHTATKLLYHTVDILDIKILGTFLLACLIECLIY
jgi:hypothetical protein